MKHKIKGRKLNRTSSHRKSLLINLSNALIKHEIIRTTLPKAKELRPFVEKLLTISKVDNLSNRRKIISVISDKDLVKKLFSDIGLRIKDRKGGYTRIMHNGFRSGDKAPMAVIEFVDKNDETNKSDAANDDVKSNDSAQPKSLVDKEDKSQINVQDYNDIKSTSLEAGKSELLDSDTATKDEVGKKKA